MFKQDYMARRIMPLAAAGVAVLGAAVSIGGPIGDTPAFSKREPPRSRSRAEPKPRPAKRVISDYTLPEIERAKRGYLHSHARRRLEEQGK